MTNYYLVSIVLAVMMLIVIAILIAENKSWPKHNKKRFYAAAFLIIAAACFEALGVLLDGAEASTRTIHIAAKFLELSVAPVIPVICGASIYPVKKKWICITLLAFHALLELASAFYGFIYVVDAENIYHHCAFYGLYCVAYLLGTVFLLVQVIRFASMYQNQNILGLTAVMALTFGGVICQAVNSSLRVVWLAVAIGFSLFCFYYNDLFLQIDPLTGLLNRGAYNDKIQNIKKTVIVLFFDIDFFKEINDVYGHSTGDHCLMAVSTEIRRVFGKIGLCYRFGGDEFCVITNHNIGTIDDYISAYNRNMGSVRNSSNPKIPFVSVGYATHHPGDSIDEAVSRADRMMYEYKQRHHAMHGTEPLQNDTKF